MAENNDENERRDRRFGHVILPKVGPLTDRDPPSLEKLGPLKHLLGVWKTKKDENDGWNMIALPFQKAPAPPNGFKFRVLMNQYKEELQFVFVDDKVPNRGLKRPGVAGSDQFVVTVDYQQKIAQVKAEDRPTSNGLAGGFDLPIHHEPGLWLYDKNRRTKDDQIKNGNVFVEKLDIARLASIPHGNSVLALGKSADHKGMPEIPPLSGLPAGQFEDVSTPDYDFKSDDYLEPYRHYVQNPFRGNKLDPSFPGFSPADMNKILRFENQQLKSKILNTTTLTVDTERKSGGISNVPFSVREAEPVSMKSTFWIQELDEDDGFGKPKLRLQYSQVVMLHFFHPRQDEVPGRAVWPHISIATLEKVPARIKIVPA